MDDFCDAVVAALDCDAVEIGYGRTDTFEIRERLAVDARLFSSGSARSPVVTYA